MSEELVRRQRAGVECDGTCGGRDVLFGKGEELMRDTILLEVAAEAESQSALAGAGIVVLDEDELLHIDLMRIAQLFCKLWKILQA